MKECKACGQLISPKWLAFKKKRRVERLLGTFEKKKSRGEPIGRKRMYDYTKLRDMRQSGMSFREIAEEMGCTISSIQRACEAGPEPVGEKE